RGKSARSGVRNWVMALPSSCGKAISTEILMSSKPTASATPRGYLPMNLRTPSRLEVLGDFDSVMAAQHPAHVQWPKFPPNVLDFPDIKASALPIPKNDLLG